MKLHTFDSFLSEKSGENVLSAKDIVTYITDITPNDSDVPDYFFSQIRKSRKKFVKQQVKIDDIIKADESLKEYIDSGSERYGEDGESDHEPEAESIDNPIVIFNGEVVDGYNRTAVKYRMGEEYIDAYVSQ